MRRFLLGCVAALTLCAGGNAQAAPAVTREFTAVGDMMTAGRCDTPRIRKLISRTDFAELSSPARSFVYSGLAFCDPKSVEDAVAKATAEPGSIALAWSLRFKAAAERKDIPDALASLRNAVDRKADGTLVFFSDEFIYTFAGDVDDDADSFRRYAAELDRADWKPTQPYYEADFIWARYAALLAESGDATHAWRIGSRVKSPGELVRMSLDTRFDKIVAVDPARFDILAAAEAQLQRARALVDANPADGSAVSITTDALRLLGRQQEALALLDAALARPGDVRDFLGQDHRNWLINDRALVLMELGRFDEGVSAMEKATALAERGGVNVSQTINLSSLQLSAGRFEAALKTLSAAADGLKGNVSPYGRMWIAANETCAYQALSRKAEAAKAFAATTAEAKANQSAYTKTLLCMGDIDALAADYKALLAASSSRGAALVQLSRFRDPALTAFDTELSQRMEAVRARPDVQAAIAAVGRTRDFPIQAGPLPDA